MLLHVFIDILYYREDLKFWIQIPRDMVRNSQKIIKHMKSCFSITSNCIMSYLLLKKKSFHFEEI